MRNQYGYDVRACCASCQQKFIRKDGVRICTLMQLKVPSQFKCSQWSMSDGLKNAGKDNQ